MKLFPITKFITGALSLQFWLHKLSTGCVSEQVQIPKVNDLVPLLPGHEEVQLLMSTQKPFASLVWFASWHLSYTIGMQSSTELYYPSLTPVALFKKS